MKKMCFFIVMIVLVMTIPQNVYGEQEAYNVLIIHSYYEHFPWTAGLQSGIENRINESGMSDCINYYMEYLDENRIGKTMEMEDIAEILETKYSGITFDCIIAGDNYALDYLKEYYHQLYTGVPIVYVGINNMTEELLFTEEMTGLAQVNDHEAMIELVQDLHPDISRLVIAGSNNKTSQGEAAMYEKVLENKDVAVPVEFIKEDMIADFYEKMKEYDEDTVVIITSLMKDPTKSNQLDGYIGNIIDQINMPVYVPVDVMLGTKDYGAVGGYIIDSVVHGEMAADIMLNILQGEKASEIEEIWESIATPKFHYNRLVQFNIDEDMLPANSIIIGAPEENNLYLLFISIALALIVIILLIYTLMQRFQIMSKQKVQEELVIHNKKLKEKNEEIDYINQHDFITGFYKRHSFIELTDHYLEEKQPVILYAIYVKSIKSFDETYGYEIGDIARKQIANIIAQVFEGHEAYFGRYYDNFYIACLETCDSEQVEVVRKRIESDLTTNIKAKDYNLEIKAKLGVAKAEMGDNGAELVRKADVTLLYAMASTKEFCSYFQKSFDQKLEEKLELENAMKEAIINNKFELYYQPQVETDTEKVVSCEALIRWQRDDGSFIGPNIFIPLAEELAIIEDIGSWVVNEACKTQAEWIKNGIDCPVSINISAKQIDKSLVKIIKEASDKYKIQPKNICLEITETAVMNETTNNIEVLEELSELGFTIALDDFGVGHSSLKYIKDFPIDELKIDKSFIDNIEEAEQLAIVKAMYQLGSIFDYKIVAEGVETKEHKKILQSIGVHILQGWYYSKALPKDQFLEYISEHC